MSRRHSKYDYSLPKLQKKIVLFLAKSEVMTANETNRKIKGEPTSTNRAFHELERKEMITKAEPKPYHGRQFWKYWLSQRGIAYALLNGSNLNTVRNLASHVIKNDVEKKALEVYFDLRSISPEVAIDLDRTLLQTDNLKPRELMMELINSMFRAFYLMSKTEQEKFHDMVGKSEELKRAWIEFLKRLRELSAKEIEILGVED